jgi:hypothetical protein
MTNSRSWIKEVLGVKQPMLERLDGCISTRSTSGVLAFFSLTR